MTTNVWLEAQDQNAPYGAFIRARCNTCGNLITATEELHLDDLLDEAARHHCETAAVE